MSRQREPLNDRHHAILAFVADYRRLLGYSPGVREIAEHLGTSTSMVNFYLNRLQREGLIKREPRVARSIVVVEP